MVSHCNTIGMMADSKLVGLTFRKTFTPSKSDVDGTEGERAIFNRLCQLFGKKTQDMDDMFRTENPAKAAADILGYSYEDRKMKDVELDAKMEIATAVSDDTSMLKDRLMKEISEKIGERRNAIMQEEEEQQQQQQQRQQEQEQQHHQEQKKDLFLKGNEDHLWKAIPAVVNPDADVSVEEIHSNGDRELSFATESCITMEQPTKDDQCRSSEMWNPECAFSQLDDLMDSLEPQPAQSNGHYHFFSLLFYLEFILHFN